MAMSVIEGALRVFTEVMTFEEASVRDCTAFVIWNRAKNIEFS